jgi:hypothetical protein
VSKSVANPPSHKRNHTASREASRRNAAAILTPEQLPLSEEAFYAGAACMAGRNLPVRQLGRRAGGTGQRSSVVPVAGKLGPKFARHHHDRMAPWNTVAALRNWRVVQNREREFFGADYQPGDFVFTFENGRPPHPDTIRQRFDRLAAAAGLSRITFHDLRHSYATGALKAGISPKVISERIGHANVGFFLQTYAHVLRNDDRDAAERAAPFLIGNGWDPTDAGDS